MATTNHIRLLAMIAVTCVLAGCVGAFVVPPKVAQATFPGENGKIAYSSYEDIGSDPEIYTIDPTGGTPVQLTDNTMYEYDPSYSPDGNKIVYSGRDGTDQEIYTIDASGGTPSQLTNNTTQDYSPSYSPDGNKIAYSGFDGTDQEIYTIDASGGTPVPLTDNTTDDHEPSYSPDGKKMVYSGEESYLDFEIYTIDSSGGTPVQLTDNFSRHDRDPSYSPDGNKVVFQGDDVYDYEIYTIDASGGTPVPLTDNNTEDLDPSYSPDSNKIVYSGREAFDMDFDIYTIDASGGTPVLLTNNTTIDWQPSWGIKLSPPDTTKPSTSATRSAEPNAAGWNKANVTVSLKATDNQGGSGVQKITYAASGAQSIARTDVTGDSAQVAFDQQGTTTLTYFATDKAANVEDQKTLKVNIDKSAPTGKVTINNGASRTRSRSVTLTLSATDPSPASGVTQMRISNTQSGLSSASWVAYSTTKAWTLSSGQGTKTVYVQYRDRAENNSAVVTDTIRFAR